MNSLSVANGVYKEKITPRMPASYMNHFSEHGCFNPECRSGTNLEVHHIIPRSRGGRNRFENYIILCHECHRKLGNHRKYSERCVILWTYKFYFESKWESEHGEMPPMPGGDSEPQDMQGRDNPEVLQSEVQDEISQLPKNPSGNHRIRLRTKRSPKKISLVGLSNCQYWVVGQFDFWMGRGCLSL